MVDHREQLFDLSVAKARALEVAQEWGLQLGAPFALSNVSYVAPAGIAVLKVAWEGDTESLHEGEALELWNGDGAVRLLRRSGRALLEERAVPGNDLSTLPDDEATTIAGLVIHEARTIPEAGQRFAFFGYQFEILRRQRNQITALRIIPPAPANVSAPAKPQQVSGS